mgnify:CR=1 FL=1
MGRKRTIDRNAILDAAEAIVTQEGAARLSFDGIARRAGVSKGGVLYSFPSRQELVAAMVRRDLDRFDADVAARRVEIGQAAGADMQAHLAATRYESPALATKAASLMAALAETPEHAEPIREHYRRLLSRFRGDGPAERRVRTALFAAEGAFLLRGLGLVKLSEAEWAALFEDIEALAAGGNEPAG